MILFTILNYIFLIPLFVAPFLYKCRSNHMVKFYSRMGTSERARKIYAFVLMFMLAMFNCSYLWQHPLELSPLASMAMLVYLYNPNRTVGMLQGIRNNKYVCGMLFTLALASLFSEQMYSLGVSLGYIVMAVMFYPSWKARSKQYHKKVYKSYEEIVEDTVSTYFR